MEPSIFTGFLLAIILGALIGVEREMPHHGTKTDGAVGFGGIRTYASIAFFGALMAWFDGATGSNLWVLFGSILSAILILASYIYSSFMRGQMGATSEYAALITYFIGVLAMMQRYTFVVIVTISLLSLLASKEYLNKLKARFSRQELGDSLKFAVIALVILPLLPDHRYSILDVANWFYNGNLDWTQAILTAKFFNPHSIWLFVVIMAGVEYAGYILSRMIGTKGGIILSGTIGGLISSTATTVAMTKKSNEHPEHRYSYATATLMASCIMFIRVIVVAYVIYPPIMSSILFPASAMFIGLVGMSGFAYYKTRGDKNKKALINEEEEKYESPFQLVPAMQFAGLIVIIKFLSILGVIYKDVIPPEISNYGLAIIS